MAAITQERIESEVYIWEPEAWTRLNGERWATVSDNDVLTLDDANMAMPDRVEDAEDAVEGEDMILLDIRRIERERGETRFVELRMNVPMAEWLRDELTRLLAARC